LIIATLITPPESEETLVRFYERCRPPGLWKRIRLRASAPAVAEPSLGHLVFDSILGIASCLGLVVLTNSLFARSWTLFALGTLGFVLFGFWLIKRILIKEAPRNPEGL
jgi:hypothetical protein